jgi:hypothetical protein
MAAPQKRREKSRSEKPARGISTKKKYFNYLVALFRSSVKGKSEKERKFRISVRRFAANPGAGF